MPRQQLNVRIPKITRRELDWLKQQYGLTEGEIVMLAIDELYHRDDKVTKVNKEISKGLVDLLASDQGVLDHPDK